MKNTFYQSLENACLEERIDLKDALDNLSYNEQGLIPVIAQQYSNGEVLMLAWMNREALEITLAEQQVCYWSRSRNQLWRKGETSGHRQQLRELRIDCDGDTILCLVEQTGPACHTNRKNCFYFTVDNQQLIVNSTPSDAVSH